MDKITLKWAAQAMGSKTELEGEISSVTTDSRAVEPESLFIALVGERLDGHEYVAKALDLGASAAVCSKTVEGCEDKIILVDDTRLAYGKLAAAYKARFDIPTVGITGSVGKTTMKDMAATVLSAKYKTLATLANHNNDIGLPRTCLRLEQGVEAAVIEMGMNHFDEISYLTKIARPTMGIITKIGVSHIENLGSREGILKAKLEILDGMDDDALLLINGDDDMLMSARESLGARARLFGIENPDCHCRAENIVQHGESQEFDIICLGERYHAKLPVIGIHNVYNACAAFLCGVLNSVAPQDALTALENYIPDSNRQRIVKKGDITVIEDCYNASPDSVKAVCSVLMSLGGEGKRIAVLGDMLELGEHAPKAHFECGEAAAKAGIDTLLCFGELSKHYIEGAKSTGKEITCAHYESKDELAKELCTMLKSGDAVLFKASHSMKFEEIFKKLYELMEA